MVRKICMDPVTIRFWSNHQTSVYKQMTDLENARLCIDATGRCTQNMIHVDSEQFGHIFLYLESYIALQDNGL